MKKNTQKQKEAQLIKQLAVRFQPTPIAEMLDMWADNPTIRKFGECFSTAAEQIRLMVALDHLTENHSTAKRVWELSERAGMPYSGYSADILLGNVGDVRRAVEARQYAIPTTKEEWLERLFQEYIANVNAVNFDNVQIETTRDGIIELTLPSNE